jgi:hypothetical protein
MGIECDKAEFEWLLEWRRELIFVGKMSKIPGQVLPLVKRAQTTARYVGHVGGQPWTARTAGAGPSSRTITGERLGAGCGDLAHLGVMGYEMDRRPLPHYRNRSGGWRIELVPVRSSDSGVGQRHQDDRCGCGVCALACISVY